MMGLLGGILRDECWIWDPEVPPDTSCVLSNGTAEGGLLPGTQSWLRETSRNSRPSITVPLAQDPTRSVGCLRRAVVLFFQPRLSDQKIRHKGICQNQTNGRIQAGGYKREDTSRDRGNGEKSKLSISSLNST
jgi:hypothetical protein